MNWRDHQSLMRYPTSNILGVVNHVSGWCLSTLYNIVWLTDEGVVDFSSHTVCWGVKVSVVIMVRNWCPRGSPLNATSCLWWVTIEPVKSFLPGIHITLRLCFKSWQNFCTPLALGNEQQYSCIRYGIPLYSKYLSPTAALYSARRPWLYGPNWSPILGRGSTIGWRIEGKWVFRVI